LVFLDLNKFKQINDTYGHAEGDKALVAFSDMIKRTFRESDVFARLGGDEFVVLLTDTSSDAVTSILDRFDKDLKTYNEQAKRGYDISYSAGIAAYDPEKHKSIEDMLAEADTLMYQQKKQTAISG
jgi:diguanylate cyclase (GGDEF)-like protein